MRSPAVSFSVMGPASHVAATRSRLGCLRQPPALRRTRPKAAHDPRAHLDYRPNGTVAEDGQPKRDRPCRRGCERNPDLTLDGRLGPGAGGSIHVTSCSSGFCNPDPILGASVGPVEEDNAEPDRSRRGKDPGEPTIPIHLGILQSVSSGSNGSRSLGAHDTRSAASGGLLAAQSSAASGRLFGGSGITHALCLCRAARAFPWPSPPQPGRADAASRAAGGHNALAKSD